MKCEICGGEFVTNRNKRTCSTKCSLELRRSRSRMAWRAKRPETAMVDCAICNVAYPKTGKAITCGKACSEELRISRDARIRKAYHQRRKLRLSIAAKLGKKRKPRLSDYPPGTVGVWDCTGRVVTRVC